VEGDKSTGSCPLFFFSLFSLRRCQGTGSVSGRHCPLLLPVNAPLEKLSGRRWEVVSDPCSKLSGARFVLPNFLHWKSPTLSRKSLSPLFFLSCIPPPFVVSQRPAGACGWGPCPSPSPPPTLRPSSPPTAPSPPPSSSSRTAPPPGASHGPSDGPRCHWTPTHGLNTCLPSGSCHGFRVHRGCQVTTCPKGGL